jgi:hypothetical protein
MSTLPQSLSRDQQQEQPRRPHVLFKPYSEPPAGDAASDGATLLEFTASVVVLTPWPTEPPGGDRHRLQLCLVTTATPPGGVPRLLLRLRPARPGDHLRRRAQTETATIKSNSNCNIMQHPMVSINTICFKVIFFGESLLQNTNK